MILAILKEDKLIGVLVHVAGAKWFWEEFTTFIENELIKDGKCITV